MDEATVIGQQMGDTEQIHAWAGEDVSWMQPTGRWAPTRDQWLRRLKNIALYTVPAVVAAVGLMWFALGGHADHQAAPPVLSYAPTAPPVPHPEQAPPDPYRTQVVTEAEFLQSLKEGGIPVPTDAVKEARDICRLLAGGMSHDAVITNTEMNHRDWLPIQAGGFTGASTGFCPKYRP